MIKKSIIEVENDNQRRVMLIEVLLSYADNTVDIHKIANSLANATPREIISHIYDGLAYGNWIWVLNRNFCK